MARVPNTLRRQGAYYFRRAIPAALQALLRRTELMCSLRTNIPGLAAERARRLYLRSEALFGLARSFPMLDDGQIAILIKRFYDFELGEENRVRLSTGVRFDENNRQAIVAYFERLGMDVRQALARNELHHADSWVSDLLEREGITQELDPIVRAKLQQGVLRASCDIASAMKKRFEGDFCHEPADPILVQEASAPSVVPADLLPAADKLAIAARPLFSIRAAEFRDARNRRGVWDAQTALQARKTYQLFRELCGDRPVGGYGREDAVRFKNLLCDLPANYGKAARYRSMTAEEIVAASAGKGDQRLTPRTIQRHLSAMSALWDDAVEQGETASNIFRGFRLPSSKRPQDQRAMWSSDRLAQLFGSPIWRGCHSADRRTKPGTEVIRDHRFWLPLIAVFSGMRQEEICQLHLEDLRKERDIWVFDVNDRPPRQLKNRNAVRLVPVHRQLLTMGLIAYADDIRAAGTERLFPELSSGGADDRLGHNFSKNFTYYRRQIGLYEPGLDFHSFRHSATTFMAHAGVAVPIIDQLTGHATPGETARYTKGFRIEQLKEAIDSIDPEVDLSHLYAAA
jgi:integrase